MYTSPPPPGNEKIIRYGKSMFDILNVKSSFFRENERWLNESKKSFAVYKKQPLRVHCKLCGNNLSPEILFSSLDVDFFLCDQCGHVNGAHEETEEFADAAYAGEGLGRFYKEPSLAEYINRLESIYMPKALFLVNSLRALNIDFSEKAFLDIGTGSGFMVGALHRLGLPANGVDVSEQQIDYGNRMLGGNYLSVYDRDQMIKIISTTHSQIISFIGVLEHINSLSKTLDAIQNNKNIQYLFFAVPMFSLSCVLGVVFPEVFNRQLATSHTHLFTQESLAWMYRQYEFTPVAEWIFGTDIMDLYRSIMVTIEKQRLPNDRLKNIISDIFRYTTDEIQLILDKSGFCSEIHVLVRVHH